jgi:DNA-binding transcriptional MerR regulator
MPAAPAAAHHPAEQPKLSSIGQVLNRLVTDFPDLTPSKLRFLEEQGLVTPQRTRSGYRKFTEADIQRIRFILALQRDHYLPLKVIRDYLQEIDNGGTPTLPGIVAPAVAGVAPAAPRWYTRTQLLEAAGVPARLLTDAVKIGLIVAAPRYGQRDLHLLVTMRKLNEYGIEPRHLRGVKATADREAGLIDTAVAPEGRSASQQRRAKAASDAKTIAELLISIHTDLLDEAIGSQEP